MLSLKCNNKVKKKTKAYKVHKYKINKVQYILYVL